MELREYLIYGAIILLILLQPSNLDWQNAVKYPSINLKNENASDT